MRIKSQNAVRHGIMVENSTIIQGNNAVGMTFFKYNAVPMALLNIFDVVFYHNAMPNGILTLNSYIFAIFIFQI